MKNMYYQLWVDGIVNSKDYKNKELGWKRNVYWLITIMNGLNIAVLFLWLDFFQIFTYKFKINSNSDSFLLSFIEGFINYVAPIAIVNYFAIFHKNRYLKLIQTHSHYKGKLAFTYSLGSLMLLVGTVLFLW